MKLIHFTARPQPLKGEVHCFNAYWSVYQKVKLLYINNGSLCVMWQLGLTKCHLNNTLCLRSFRMLSFFAFRLSLKLSALSFNHVILGMKIRQNTAGWWRRKGVEKSTLESNWNSKQLIWHPELTSCVKLKVNINWFHLHPEFTDSGHMMKVTWRGKDHGLAGRCCSEVSHLANVAQVYLHFI